MTAVTIWIQDSPLVALVVLAAVLTWALVATLVAWRQRRVDTTAAHALPSATSLDRAIASLRAQLSQVEDILNHLTEAQTELKQGLMDLALALGQPRGAGANATPVRPPAHERLQALAEINANPQPDLLNQALHLLQHADPQQVAAFEGLLIHAAESEQRRLRSHQLASELAAELSPEPRQQGPGRLAAWQRLERLSGDLQALMDLSAQGMTDLSHSQHLLTQLRTNSSAPEHVSHE
jgi:hypothetical protein